MLNKMGDSRSFHYQTFSEVTGLIPKIGKIFFFI